MHEFNVGGKVNHVQFLPDGERLLISVGSGSCDNLMIWHPLEDSRRTLIDSSAGFWWRTERVALPRHGDFVYVADQLSIRRFQLSDDQQFAWKAGAWVEQLAVSNDGQKVVISTRRSLRGYDIAGQQLWDIENLYNQFEQPPDADVNSLSIKAFKILAIVGDDIVWRQSAWNRNKLRKTNVMTSQTATGFIALPSMSEPTFNSSSNAGLFGIGDIHGIHILDSKDNWNATRLSINNHYGHEQFAFCGNQSIGVIPNNAREVRMFELTSLTQTQTLKWNIGELTCLDFSPVTGMGVAGSKDGRVMLWDMD